MAFYKDIKPQTRKEKQMNAQARGGFDDEGSRYSGKGKPAGRGGHGGFGSQGSRGGYGSFGKQGGNGRRFEDERRYDDRPARKDFRDPKTNRGQGGYGFDDRRPAPRRDQGERRYDDRPARKDFRDPKTNRGQGGYGFDDRRPAPRRDQGERRYDDRPARKDFRNPKTDRNQGEMRFSKFTPRYEERGSNTTPQSYAEQKQNRRDEEFRPSRRFEGPAAYQTSMDAEVEIVPNENLLSGRNPIREALKSGRDIEKLLVARGELSGSAREIVQMAKERHIPVQEVDRSRLDDITHNHQGMLAFASAYQYSTVEHMLEVAKERGEEPFLILLDGITDPHNLGAIIRTAECVGAHGVIVQERRAVGLTPAAVKASAGAVEHLPVARVTNLCNTIEVLQAQNIWVYAADMDGESYDSVNFQGGAALVIGAEGEGVGRRVLDTCDKTVAIPLRGKLDSLNASVAAGILMYAVLRSR